MLAFLKRTLYFFSNKLRRKTTDKKWTADFSKPEKSPFPIKTESSYNAYLSNGSLTLALKKPNFINWVETPDLDYQDQIIEARFRLDGSGGYIAAGLLFRIAGEGSYYAALVSSKGYFRLDAVTNSSPQPLIGWTEVSGFDGTNVNLNIISFGIHLIVIVNGQWLGELVVVDDSITSGRLGFVLTSYETASNENYTCLAQLDFLSVDPRLKAVQGQYKKWNESQNIGAESRLRLAETFAVMGAASQALDQITKVWLQREKAARSVTATYTDSRTRKELLLAARMTFRLGHYREAEEFIDACLEQGIDTGEGRAALTEKAKILGELEKYNELKEFILKHLEIINKDSDLYVLLAQSHQKLNEYEAAASAWSRAFEMKKENGVYAVNAANALEFLGNKDEALPLFLEAGTLFLRQYNQAELAALIPKLAVLGKQNWEARALAGKWAFSIEDYDQANSEFIAAERLRGKLKPKPPADPAVSYLRGLIFSIKSNYKDAVRFLEQAVSLAPDYDLFRFQLAENRIYLNSAHNPPDQKFSELVNDLRSDFDRIDNDPDGQIANHIGTLLLNSGDLESAGYFFTKALSVAPDNSEYITNRCLCLEKEKKRPRKN
jgi:tetratricopeptide (TPR) repeat protein